MFSNYYNNDYEMFVTSFSNSFYVYKYNFDENNCVGLYDEDDFVDNYEDWEILENNENVACSYDNDLNEQIIFICITCNELNQNYSGFCINCSKVCHQDHEVINIGFNNIFK
jgi:hemerythrin superfamily protein